MGMEVRLNHHLMGSFMMHRFVVGMMRSNLMVHRGVMDLLLMDWQRMDNVVVYWLVAGRQRMDNLMVNWLMVDWHIVGWLMSGRQRTDNFVMNRLVMDWLMVG